MELTGAVLLPIGHCLGVRPDPETGIPAQRIRVGPDVVRLSEPQFTVWALAHGDPSADELWGPDAVLDAAEGLLDPAGVLAGLADDGLLAAVTPGTPGALEFARRYQLKPLMTGLGNRPEDPAVYEIGLPGQPVAQIGDVLFRLYLWGHLEPDLWSACRATAQLSGGEYADPYRLLDAVLGALHTLLSPNAAYLDSAAS